MGVRAGVVGTTTLAIVGALAVPAGAALNGNMSAIAALQEHDLSTVDGVQAALAAASPEQAVAILNAALAGKSANDVLAIVAAAVKQFPGSAAALVSEAAAQRPQLAAQITSSAVTSLPPAIKAATAPVLVRAASTASGVKTADIAAIVAADNGLGNPVQLASSADNVQLASLNSSGDQTPTGSIDQGTRGNAPSNTDAFVPSGMRADSGTPGGGTGTPEGSSANAAQNNGVDQYGNGPNASPV